MYEFDQAQQYQQQEEDQFDFGSTDYLNLDGTNNGAEDNYGGYNNAVFEEDETTKRIREEEERIQEKLREKSVIFFLFRMRNTS